MSGHDPKTTIIVCVGADHGVCVCGGGLMVCVCGGVGLMTSVCCGMIFLTK